MRYMVLGLLVMSGFLSAAEVKDAAGIKDSAGMSADQKAALACFQAFLDGLGKRDKAAMTAQLLPGGSVVLMRKGKPVQMTLEALADRLSQPGAGSHEERIRDAVVHVDGDVGTIWAPFEFLLDGKIDHCGRDIANVVRIDGRWVIAALEDNSRTECGAH
jgi:Putative lumazine-binding